MHRPDQDTYRSEVGHVAQNAKEVKLHGRDEWVCGEGRWQNRSERSISSQCRTSSIEITTEIEVLGLTRDV